MASTIRLDKKAVLAQVASLSDIVKENSWEFDYDSSIDTLTYSEKVIPDNSFLVSVDDDISFYIDKEFKLRGLMIEYFRGNYIEHNKELEPVVKILITKTDKRGKKKLEWVAAEELFRADVLRESIPNLLKQTEFKTAI
jgi:hypothetical protein